LWDVTKIEDSYILPGDGSSHTIGERNLGTDQGCIITYRVFISGTTLNYI